jgi:glycosyltransferase involved in cell wall biosynthesis
MMRVCFFCRTNAPEVLARNEFYAVDLAILRDLGHEVVIATDPLRIPPADLYLVWWWTWAFFPLLRAWLAGKPIIIVGVFDHIMPDGSLDPFDHRPALHRWLMRAALRWADANVFSSQLELEHCRRRFTVRRPSFAHLTVDSDAYRPGHTPRGDFLLTFCWMLEGNARRKCIPEAIRATARLHERYPQLKLIVAGEKKANGYAMLNRLVEELGAGDYVEFPGVVSKEDKIALMQRCAVYLQPTRVEGFGVAIAEALACGAAVVSSPVGAVPEVVGDTAVMVDGTDPEAIASAVVALLEDPARCAALGERGRARVMTMFPYQRRKADLERVINTVMAARGNRAR